MRSQWFVLVAVAILASELDAEEAMASQRIVPLGQSSTRAFSTTVPRDCPFEKSKDLSGMVFTGRYTNYTRADTWSPAWASDDRIYSPFTDGSVNGVRSGSGYNFTKLQVPTTGFAVVEGSDPMKLKITRVGLLRHEPFPYGGQYPCGSLVHNGVCYS